MEQQIINAFKSTKRTQDKVIVKIEPYFDKPSNKTIYFVNMEDGSKYIYSYELKQQHKTAFSNVSPQYYHRIIKVGK